MLNMRDPDHRDEFAGNKWKLIDVSASTIPSSFLSSAGTRLAEFSKIQPDIHFLSGSQQVDAIEK